MTTATARIVLLGATGYTGSRTAEAMTRRGLRPVLAGRDPARLATLAERFGGLSTASADVTDPASVRALVDRRNGPTVLVSTVGPFLRWGEAAVSAAADAGAVYLDSTGEPPFIRRVFERYGPRAANTGAALLTAFGHDYLPGTLAGALALAEGGAATSAVHVGYFISARRRGQPFSRGTLSSLVGVMREPMYRWRDGALRDEPAGARYRTFDVAGRRRPGVSIGAVEQFALPRLAATGLAPRLREVDVYLGWFGPISRAVHLGSRAAPLLSRMGSAGRLIDTPAARMVGTPASRLVDTVRTAARRAAMRWVADEPNAASLASITCYVVAEALGGSGQRLASVTLTSPDPYAITAELLAWGAGRAAEHGVSGTGALDPLCAFGLDPLRDGAAEAGIVQA